MLDKAPKNDILLLLRTQIVGEKSKAVAVVVARRPEAGDEFADDVANDAGHNEVDQIKQDPGKEDIGRIMQIKTMDRADRSCYRRLLQHPHAFVTAHAYC